MGLPSVGPFDKLRAARSQWSETATIETSAQPLHEHAPHMRWAQVPTTLPTAAAMPARIAGAEDEIEPSAAELKMPAPSSGAFTSPILGIDARRVRLTQMDEGEVRTCTKCPLCNTRENTVFGEGAADARLMFVGEGPGGKEDQTGRPFVGPAGELLNRMIGAMGLKREQVYIANIVKCRAYMQGPPPKDRAPAPEEVAACSPYLERQVEIIRPQVIVTLGLPASQFVLQTKSSMSRLRGNWSAWHGIKVMPTWHPSYLLRRERDGDVEPKRQAWGDLQKVMAELGLATPPRKG